MAKPPEAPHPIKLERDAIVEAICEIRFEGKSGVSGILPGMLFAELRGVFTGIEKMPAMDLPPFMVELNPQMRYLATQKLIGDGLAVIVGEHVLGVACSPYLGWAKFKSRILEIWAVLAKLDLIGEPTRVALKYINLLDEQTDDLTDVANINLQIGNLTVKNQPSQIRTEFVDGRFSHIVMIASPAMATPVGEAPKQGCLVDVDVICNTPHPGILSNGESELDELHQRVKGLFFSIISDTALKARGPIYG